MINYTPEIEPEDFRKCPILLVHPGNDCWTDLSLSRLTFDKFKCEKYINILEGAGHFPIEQPGLSQLENYIIDYIEEVIMKKVK
jgi:alpha-beta hydrolase superfamily lysophospholipase